MGNRLLYLKPCPRTGTESASQKKHQPSVVPVIIILLSFRYNHQTVVPHQGIQICSRKVIPFSYREVVCVMCKPDTLRP